MRNLFDFLAKHSNWLLFLILEVVSLALVFRYNAYQGSVWVSSANVVAGKMYEWHSEFTSFFHLRQNNTLLTNRNFHLERQVRQLTDAYNRVMHDSTAAEKLLVRQMQQYHPIEALVVGNTVAQKDNMITINKGTADGVRPEMGVVSGTGVVGVVMKASAHYAIVMPVINSNSRVSCTIRKRGYFGALRWHGGSISRVYLEDIPRHARFAKGDWVETNGYSAIFPPGVPVGCITRVFNSRDGLSYNVEVQLSTDFSRLRDVLVLNDTGMQERLQLMKEGEDSLKTKGK
ncbi:MAG: rod shape-determining protein MreC [Prevotella sp.]